MQRKQQSMLRVFEEQLGRQTDGLQRAERVRASEK